MSRQDKLFSNNFHKKLHLNKRFPTLSVCLKREILRLVEDFQKVVQQAALCCTKYSES